MDILQTIALLKFSFQTITILLTGYLILDLIQMILTLISSKIKQAREGCYHVTELD